MGGANALGKFRRPGVPGPEADGRLSDRRGANEWERRALRVGVTRGRARFASVVHGTTPSV